MGKRKTEKDYCSLAKSREFRWVGEVLPKDVLVSTWWECKKCKCIWKATYNNINKGRGCPDCAGLARKTERDYHELAESRGFKWLGPLPKSTKDPTWWECEKGDRWQVRYGSVQQGNGCPGCAGQARKIEKDYYELAEIRGFGWLGPFPKTTHIRTWWKCKKCSYMWEARYDNIKQGRGCPKCKDMINGTKVSKPQRKLNTLLHGSLNYPESRYRIDVAVIRNSQKIAVEYDSQYWHQGNEEQDSRRDDHLIFCGWKVLHIKSGKLLPTKKQLKKAINNLLKKDNNIINLYLEDWRR